jgi:hypothetical protein
VVPPVLVAVASPLVAVLGVTALFAAIRRRMPTLGLPVCFGALGLSLGLVIRAAVAGPHWALPLAGVAVGGAWAALAWAAVTIDSQLDPWWWRRFERDLAAWRSSEAAAAS